jgi:hypothetical protein
MRKSSVRGIAVLQVKKNRLGEAVFWDSAGTRFASTCTGRYSTALGWKAKVKPAGKEEFGHVIDYSANV